MNEKKKIQDKISFFFCNCFTDPMHSITAYSSPNENISDPSNLMPLQQANKNSNIVETKINMYKTLWEKEKKTGHQRFLLFPLGFRKSINFCPESFKFSRLGNPVLLNRGFNSFPTIAMFSYVCSKSLLKTLREKEKFLIISNFSFFQCFLPIWRTF